MAGFNDIRDELLKTVESLIDGDKETAKKTASRLAHYLEGVNRNTPQALSGMSVAMQRKLGKSVQGIPYSIEREISEFDANTDAISLIDQVFPMMVAYVPNGESVGVGDVISVSKGIARLATAKDPDRRANGYCVKGGEQNRQIYYRVGGTGNIKLTRVPENGSRLFLSVEAGKLTDDPNEAGSLYQQECGVWWRMVNNSKNVRNYADVVFQTSPSNELGFAEPLEGTVASGQDITSGDLIHVNSDGECFLAVNTDPLLYATHVALFVVDGVATYTSFGNIDMNVIDFSNPSIHSLFLSEISGKATDVQAQVAGNIRQIVGHKTRDSVDGKSKVSLMIQEAVVV